MSADTAYEQQNDLASAGDVQDNDYASRTGQNEIPVQKDDALIEDPIDPETADSDDTLAKDETDAIDESNIIDERTRGAKPVSSYLEPGDEEGLPTDDGTSSN